MIRIPFGAALGLSLATPGRRPARAGRAAQTGLQDQAGRLDVMRAGAAGPRVKRTEH